MTHGMACGALRAMGTTVDFADARKGTQAPRCGVPVAAYNVRHFSKITGLDVVRPNEKAPGGDAEGQED